MNQWADRETKETFNVFVNAGGFSPILKNIAITSDSFDTTEEGEIDLFITITRYVDSPFNLFSSALMFDTNKTFMTNYKSIIDCVNITQDWFETTYPRLSKSHYWIDLRDKSIPKSLDIIGQEILDKLNDKKQTLLGLTISGPHIGYIAPITVFFISLYMMIFLFQLKRSVERDSAEETSDNHGDFSPWIGAMRGILPLILTGVSLVALPAFSVWLALSRVLGLTVIAWGATILFSGMGLYSVFAGWSISKLIDPKK
jgi:hypothetical protein